ncbi:MAG: hypothetical protein ACI95S_001608 [Dinoroseobacter sp.]|jgi:hypothetical protein
MLVQDLTLVGALITAAIGVTGLITAWVDDHFPIRGLAFLILAGVLGWETWESRGRVLVFDDVPIALMRLINLALQAVS